MCAASCLGQCAGDSELLTVCVTAPVPEHVRGHDMFRHGHNVREYRKVVGDCIRDCCEIKCPIPVCFISTSLCIPFECYTQCVIRTIKAVEGCECKEMEKLMCVLRAIYDAVQRHHGCDEDLLGFTAVAMHNMYTFVKFTRMDPNDRVIGHVSRGLMQYTAGSYYKDLSALSNHNYCLHPYLLNGFTAKSIDDEFVIYQRCFSLKQPCTPMALVIIRLAPHEAKLLDPKTNGFIAGIDSIDCPDLKKKVKRRMHIYNTLLCCMLNAEVKSPLF